MIENIWCALCKDIVVDAQTNMVSYLNCLEQINVKKLPIVFPPFSVGTLWAKTSDTLEILKVKISVITPSGTIKKPFETEDIKMEKPRQRVHIAIQGLPIEETGIYKVKIEFFKGKKWICVKEIPFDVIQVKK